MYCMYKKNNEAHTIRSKRAFKKIKNLSYSTLLYIITLLSLPRSQILPFPFLNLILTIISYSSLFNPPTHPLLPHLLLQLSLHLLNHKALIILQRLLHMSFEFHAFLKDILDLCAQVGAQRGNGVS